MFAQFHANKVLSKSVLAYFVTLIPKVASPLVLKDYRSIFLLGCLYKLLSKGLARRLVRVYELHYFYISISFTKRSKFGG